MSVRTTGVWMELQELSVKVWLIDREALSFYNILFAKEVSIYLSLLWLVQGTDLDRKG